MNNYKPIIQNFGVMNQHLISRYLDYGALDNLPVLQNVDKKLQKLWAECKAEIPAQYIWRTRGDDKVRGSHAANNGKVFSRDNPPSTGNPGDEFGCRCWAEEYVAGKSEFAYQELTSFVHDAPHKWIWYDFVLHSIGNAEDVTLSQIGHLQDIIFHYAYKVNGGIFNRINEQIIAEARKAKNGYFVYPFSGSYDFEDVSYPHGSSVVRGEFKGMVSENSGRLSITGEIQYIFEDKYTDPVDIRELLNGTSDPHAVSELWRKISDGGGKVYKISGNWQTEFKAEVNLDKNDSIIKHEENK